MASWNQAFQVHRIASPQGKSAPGKLEEQKERKKKASLRVVATKVKSYLDSIISVFRVLQFSLSFCRKSGKPLQSSTASNKRALPLYSVNLRTLTFRCVLHGGTSSLAFIPGQCERGVSYKYL